MGRKPARDAEHTVDLGPAPRPDLFLERGNVSAVLPIANRQRYATRNISGYRLTLSGFTCERSGSGRSLVRQQTYSVQPASEPYGSGKTPLRPVIVHSWQSVS
jgi:hypothetical protein